MKNLLLATDLSFQELESEYKRRDSKRRELASKHAREYIKLEVGWWEVTRFDDTKVGWVYGNAWSVETEYPTDNSGYANYIYLQDPDPNFYRAPKSFNKTLLQTSGTLNSFIGFSKRLGEITDLILEGKFE